MVHSSHVDMLSALFFPWLSQYTWACFQLSGYPSIYVSSVVIPTYTSSVILLRFRYTIVASIDELCIGLCMRRWGDHNFFFFIVLVSKFECLQWDVWQIAKQMKVKEVQKRVDDETKEEKQKKSDCCVLQCLPSRDAAATAAVGISSSRISPITPLPLLVVIQRLFIKSVLVIHSTTRFIPRRHN